jgi:hypothetical protein
LRLFAPTLQKAGGGKGRPTASTRYAKQRLAVVHTEIQSIYMPLRLRSYFYGVPRGKCTYSKVPTQLKNFARFSEFLSRSQGKPFDNNFTGQVGLCALEMAKKDHKQVNSSKQAAIAQQRCGQKGFLPQNSPRQFYPEKIIDNRTLIMTYFLTNVIGITIGLESLKTTQPVRTTFGNYFFFTDLTENVILRI